MSTYQRFYMADEKVLYKTLVDLCKFCHAQSYSVLMTKDELTKKAFKINITNSIYLEINVEVTQNKHTRPYPVVELVVDAFSAHTKGTKKVANTIKSVGKVIGAGIGLVVSIFTAGIGWILGSGITLGAAKVGEMPGKLVDKIDTFLTDNALEKYSGEIQAVIGLFAGRMIELPRFDIESPDVVKFCNAYIKEHQKYMGHFRCEKKNLSFSFNGITKGKNTVKFYRTLSCDDAGFIMELKNKTVESSEIKSNEDTLVELVCEYYSHYIGDDYEQWIIEKGHPPILENKETLVEELRKQLT